jgi:hypothetical protein
MREPSPPSLFLGFQESTVSDETGSRLSIFFSHADFSVKKVEVSEEKKDLFRFSGFIEFVKPDEKSPTCFEMSGELNGENVIIVCFPVYAKKVLVNVSSADFAVILQAMHQLGLRMATNIAEAVNTAVLLEPAFNESNQEQCACVKLCNGACDVALRRNAKGWHLTVYEKVLVKS